MAGRRTWALWVLSGIFMQGEPVLGAEPTRKPVDAAIVASFPAPGTVVPGSFAFTPDNKSLTFLKSESQGASRVLWRVEVAEGSPRVIARPSGRGDTDTNVSQAEALRRERMRLRDTGITQIVLAEKAEIAVIPLQGDLYLLRGDGPLERLTETKAPEIDHRDLGRWIRGSRLRSRR